MATSFFGHGSFDCLPKKKASLLFWRLLFGALILVGLSFSAHHAHAQNVTQSDWYLQQGQIVTPPATFPSHGHATQYNYASIPAWPGPGWSNAPDLRVIAYFQASRLCGGTYVCQRDLDFLYFLTELNVPAGITVNSFTVTSSQVDDGIRVTVFNSSNPNGITLPNAYMYLGTNVTSGNLAAAIKPGEINTVVLTVVDDCCQRVGPGNVVLSVNGSPINTYNNPPQITKLPSTTATEDQPYAPAKVEATDIDSGDTLSYKLTKAPIGATINPVTGEITWTPGDADAGKEVEFEVEVCDSKTPPACKKATWKVQVTNVNDPPVITSTPPTTATEDQAYNYKPTATDPDPGTVLAWHFTKDATGANKAPPGATIDPATGEIKWTPRDADAGKEVDFEIEVCDNATPPACTKQSWKTKVANVNDPPVITSTAPTETPTNQEMSYKPTVSDPDPGDTHTWKLNKGPAGATIDPATGEVKWTPGTADAGKDTDFEIEVCDNATPPACTTQIFRVKPYNTCAVDADCPQQEICETGRCIAPGCANQSPQCTPTSNICLKGQCGADPCANKQCATDETCRPSDGKCIKACAGVQCPTGQKCVDGACLADPCNQGGTACAANEYCDTTGTTPACKPNPCTTSSCRHGRLCDSNICVDDPCAKMTCPNPQTQRCEAGQCIDRLPCKVDLNCPADQICINQLCQPPGCHPLQPQCTPTTQLCTDGTCKDNPCLNKMCGQDQFCRPLDGACAGSCSTVQCPTGQTCVDGACQADPCANQQCAAGQVCVAGTCEAEQCSASNACKHGRICRTDTNRCESDPCLNVSCPNTGEVCRFGQCVAPPSCAFDQDCPSTNLCVNGKCVSSQCSSTNPCPQGKRCSNGQCADDLCTNKQCPADTFCNNGQCVDSCAGVFCPQGKICNNGQCTDDPCANKQCATGEICQNGMCIPNNCQTNSCKDGRKCIGDRCVDDPCLGITCPTGQTCSQGQCTGDKACQHDATCGADGVCLNKLCAPKSCYPSDCPQGELCISGKCTANPCANKQCATDETCRPLDGNCVKDCPKCPDGQVCEAGVCQTDPCAGVQCAQDEFCRKGQCIKDTCKLANTILCRHQRICSPEQCSDDPCLGITCKAGQACQAGVCTATSNNEPNTETVSEPNTESTSEQTSESTSETTPQEQAIPDGSVGEKIAGETTVGDQNNADSVGAGIVGGGCGCNQNEPTFPLGSLLFLLLFLVAMRKRSPSLRA
ncbi:MAG: hypothetical protein H6728_16505 [Myxococcales bacterium]|nr:hypothetical protein [Myxococcales bacterium]